MRALQTLQTAAVFPSGLWFQVPRKLSPVLTVEDDAAGQVYFLFLDDLLATHLGAAFGANEKPSLLRVTRDGDFTVDFRTDDPDEVDEQVRSSVRMREVGK
ncbi:MAG: hypothetical protein HYZ53_13160, partial [Planctomycetes bacterium]|nr:hypothetical protein [Planctomycetota bacterium]